MQFKQAMKQVAKGIAIAALSVSAFAGPVNVNSADAITIAKELSGVGEKRAAAIVTYRDENGEFASLGDLEKVTGVGKTIVEANAESILFK